MDTGGVPSGQLPAPRLPDADAYTGEDRYAHLFAYGYALVRGFDTYEAAFNAYRAGAADMRQRVRDAADADADKYARRYENGDPNDLANISAAVRAIADAYRAGGRALDGADDRTA